MSYVCGCNQSSGEFQTTPRHLEEDQRFYEVYEKSNGHDGRGDYHGVPTVESGGEKTYMHVGAGRGSWVKQVQVTYTGYALRKPILFCLIFGSLVLIFALAVTFHSGAAQPAATEESSEEMLTLPSAQDVESENDLIVNTTEPIEEPSYECTVGRTNWEAWSDEKKVYCCDNDPDRLGCVAGSCDQPCHAKSDDKVGTCRLRIQWSASHGFHDDAQSCAHAHSMVLKNCPGCSLCALSQAACIEAQAPATIESST